MQEINNGYEILSERLINSNPDFSAGRKSWEHFVSEEIRVKLNEIIFLEDVTIEIIGSWIWVTWNTRAVKEQRYSFMETYTPLLLEITGDGSGLNDVLGEFMIRNIGSPVRIHDQKYYDTLPGLINCKEPATRLTDYGWQYRPQVPGRSKVQPQSSVLRY